MAGFCVVGPIWFLFYSRADSNAVAILLLLGLGGAALLAWGIVSAFRTRLEFLPSGIRLTKGFGQPLDVETDEVKGYRVVPGRNSRSLMILFKDAARKPLRVDMAFERQAQLSRLLAKRFHNLDDEEVKAEMKEILSDPELGSSEEERQAALQRARIQVGVLNAATAASVFWAMLYPRPYVAAIALLAALPLIAVILVRFSRGAVTLDSKRGSVRPNVAYAMLGPGMVVGVRAMLDWHILGWSAFWIPFAVLAAILLGLFLVGTAGDAQRKAGTLVLLIFVCLAQSYGLVLFLNCEFDRSVPEIHRTTVVGRRVSRGRKSTTYYLTVSPWIDGGYSEEISVPSSTYGWHEEGSTILIGVRQGSLSMPWFFVQ